MLLYRNDADLRWYEVKNIKNWDVHSWCTIVKVVEQMKPMNRNTVIFSQAYLLIKKVSNVTAVSFRGVYLQVFRVCQFICVADKVTLEDFPSFGSVPCVYCAST